MRKIEEETLRGGKKRAFLFCFGFRTLLSASVVPTSARGHYGISVMGHRESLMENVCVRICGNVWELLAGGRYVEPAL